MSRRIPFWLTTTAAGPPDRFSSGRNVRPRNGSTDPTRKKSDVTNIVGARSGSSAPSTVAVRGPATAASASNDLDASRQSPKFTIDAGSSAPLSVRSRSTTSLSNARGTSFARGGRGSAG